MTKRPSKPSSAVPALTDIPMHLDGLEARKRLVPAPRNATRRMRTDASLTSRA